MNNIQRPGRRGSQIDMVPVSKEYLANYKRVNIYAFLHVYCNPDNDNWKVIFNECISSLLYSGLYGVLQNIFLGINYIHENDLEYINRAIHNLKKIKIKKTSTNLKDYEFTTLRILQEELDNFDYCLYFHTKNASRDYNDPRYFNDEKWRQAMLINVIHKYNIHLEALTKGYDSSGCRWHFGTHYQGNYWFAKSSYLKTLPNIDEMLYTKQGIDATIKRLNWVKDSNEYKYDEEKIRYLAECWLGFTYDRHRIHNFYPNLLMWEGDYNLEQLYI